MFEKITIRANYDYAMGSLCVRIFEKDGRELVACGQPIEMKEIDKNYIYVPPAIQLDRAEQLQELFDDLWGMGLRPSARSDEYKAQLETMKDHLNDMRELVFKGKRKDL